MYLGLPRATSLLSLSRDPCAPHVRSSGQQVSLSVLSGGVDVLIEPDSTRVLANAELWRADSPLSTTFLKAD